MKGNENYPSPAGGGAPKGAVAGPENYRRRRVEPILATLATTAATRIIRALVPPAPNNRDFAEILRGHLESSPGRAVDSARIEEFVDRISELPLTSSEARELARELQALLDEVEKSETPAGLTGRLKEILQAFVARVSENFLLSREDSARLAEVAHDWAQRQFGTAAGASSVESTA